jgi:hypothetical protein
VLPPSIGHLLEKLVESLNKYDHFFDSNLVKKKKKKKREGDSFGRLFENNLFFITLINFSYVIFYEDGRGYILFKCYILLKVQLSAKK